MILREVRVAGWRNLAAATLRPGPRVTVLYGDNGQGKTNLVEAAYFLTTFRSFRTTRLAEIESWDKPGARVSGTVSVGGLERALELTIANGRKTALLDGKAVRRDARSLQGIAAVLFVPGDLSLPRAAPAERRRFLDRAIFASDRTYASEAMAFERVLRNRNVVLRDPGARPALLETYDEELAKIGARIVGRRRALVASLAPRVTTLYKRIHGDIPVRVHYRSHPTVEAAETRDDVVTALHAGLESRRAVDLRRGFTGFGPHTDDLELDLAAHTAGDHGSQGQLRSLVLSLKLAELENLAETLDEPPLLMLDDVASELDETRRGKLFETIAALAGQTLLTVTDRELLPTLRERCDFEVRNGVLRADDTLPGDNRA